MKYFVLSCLLPLFLLCGFAQEKEKPSAGQEESDHLNNVLEQAGSSPQEFIRALEDHLAAYPEAARKPEIERGLMKASIEVNDKARIIKYGELVLAEDPEDVQALEKVTLALLASDDKARSEKALVYAKRLESVVRKYENDKPESPREQARWREQIERALGRSLVFQARASGNTGKLEEAVALARKAYETYPTAESAREIGRWLAETGKYDEAVSHYAEAFMMPDPRNGDADRAKDRAKLSELYRKAHGSEAGLGDMTLEAYDRLTALMAARRERMREYDPNADLSDPMDFTLSGLNGDKLALRSLRGKVVVLDFWATWCGPCRAQHPLYEQVKQKFKDNRDVVFLSINTDTERETVKPFLEENNWTRTVYFEDGLSSLLKVSSIPTTVIIGKQGNIASRMNGFNFENFVDLLTGRIRRLLAD